MSSPVTVGIFQAYWPLQVHTLNLARELSLAGIRVHLFLYDAGEGMVEMEEIENLPLVSVHRIESAEMPGNPLSYLLSRPDSSPEKTPETPASSHDVRRKTSLQSSLSDQIKNVLGQMVLSAVSGKKRRLWEEWCHRSLVRPGVELLSGARLDYVIGVEPYGLLWADAVGKHFQAKSLQYSLELKNEKWIGVNARVLPLFRRLFNEALSRSSAVIIQDADRLGELRKMTGWSGKRAFYVPVSLLGHATKNKTNYLHRELNIQEHKKIILAFGWINGHRGSAELIEAAKSFPDDWVLVFHSGLSTCNDAALIKKVTEEMQDKVAFSLKRLNSAELDLMVGSADIGLCFYTARDENERMTGRSSEKMARYAKAGLPVVAWNYPSYQSVFAQQRFGLCVERYSDVPRVLAEIFSQYENFRERSFAAYDAIYQAEPHYEPIIEWMLADKPSVAGRFSSEPMTTASFSL